CSPRPLRTAREQRLATRPFDCLPCGGAVDRAECIPRLAQPLEALPLIRERPLGPRASIDDALDELGAPVERGGVGEEEGRVDAADLGEERTQRRRGDVAREPVCVPWLEAGE